MSTETVEVRFAPPSLAPAAVCCIWRHVDAESARPVNARVPANIYACLNLVLQGRVELATKPRGVLPDFFVTGPFTRPLPTATVGPLHSVSLVVQPWLLRTWFGWAPAELLDALQDLQVPPAATLAGRLHRALLAAAPGPAAAERLWEALQAIGDPAARFAPSLALQELLLDGVAGAARTLGLGERQYERRFGSAMGMPPRTWLRIRRFESALVIALAGEDTGAAPLAQLAAQAGYADQAHLTRAFRAGTGEPPARLLRQLRADRPGYWAFRPASVGFVQDGNKSAG